MKRTVETATLFAALLALSCSPEPPPQAERKPMTGAEFRAMIQPAPRTAVLAEEGWFDWGASMVRSADGKCHLYYAQWPAETQMSGWLSDSVISYATADNPLGPYQPQGIILKGRGGDYWDAEMVHNPTIKKFGEKYYLYHIGTRKTATFDDYRQRGIFRDKPSTHADDHANRRVNQRIGVAVADSPEGPWQRFEEPIIDVEPGGIRHYFVCNPSVTETPEGDYLMVYKSMDADSRMVHGVARADKPEGPFQCYPDPIFTAGDDGFPAEDPFIWHSGGFYYAIVKDFKGSFTGHTGGHSLALFYSTDGIDWRPTEDPLVSTTEIRWTDGTTEKLSNLERPQLWLDNGRPAVLFCAARSPRVPRSFNVHIPLQ